MKLNKLAFLPDKATRNQLNNLNINELVTICKNSRSIKLSFKKYLIEYVIKLIKIKGTWRVK